MAKKQFGSQKKYQDRSRVKGKQMKQNEVYGTWSKLLNLFVKSNLEVTESWGMKAMVSFFEILLKPKIKAKPNSSFKD